jgi:hypothetical protein
MACSGNQSQCCGDANILSVFSIWESNTPSTFGTETSTPQCPRSAHAHQSPSQGFPKTGTTSPLNSNTGAITAITSTMPSSESNPTDSGTAVSTNHTTSPPWTAASSTRLNHSSPQPGPPSSPAAGSIINSGFSETGGSETHTPLLPSSSSGITAASSDTLDGRLNKAIIAGAAIGGAVIVAGFVFGIWFNKKRKQKKRDDDDVSMVGIPRDEDVPLEMRNGIRRVRGNDD